MWGLHTGLPRPSLAAFVAARERDRALADRAAALEAVRAGRGHAAAARETLSRVRHHIGELLTGHVTAPLAATAAKAAPAPAAADSGDSGIALRVVVKDTPASSALYHSTLRLAGEAVEASIAAVQGMLDLLQTGYLMRPEQISVACTAPRQDAPLASPPQPQHGPGTTLWPPMSTHLPSLGV
jgi:hypothetical protein